MRPPFPPPPLSPLPRCVFFRTLYFVLFSPSLHVFYLCPSFSSAAKVSVIREDIMRGEGEEKEMYWRLFSSLSFEEKLLQCISVVQCTVRYYKPVLHFSSLPLICRFPPREKEEGRERRVPRFRKRKYCRGRQWIRTAAPPRATGSA